MTTKLLTEKFVQDSIIEYLFRKGWSRNLRSKGVDEHALEQGTNLLNLMRIVHQPIKKEWLEKYNEKLREQQASYPKTEEKS